MGEKINPILLGLAILIVLGLYFLWQIGQGREAVIITQSGDMATGAPAVAASVAVVTDTKISNDGNSGKVIKTAGKYVGSKSGKRYHLPSCPGAKRIKEENKVWFESKEAAEKAGYSPAANCQGI